MSAPKVSLGPGGTIVWHGEHADHGVDLGQEPRHATNRNVEASRLQVEYWAAQAEQVHNQRLAARLRAL